MFNKRTDRHGFARQGRASVRKLILFDPKVNSVKVKEVDSTYGQAWLTWKETQKNHEEPVEQDFKIHLKQTSGKV